MENTAGKKQFKGFGFYFVLLCLMVLGIWLMLLLSENKGTYGYRNFKNDLENKNIKSITITQNNQSVGGRVDVITLNNEAGHFNVVDTATVWNLCIDNDIEPVVKTAKSVSTIVTIVVPYLVIVVIFFLLMSGLSVQGGGNNSKMMNFGRSRAHMITDAAKKGFNFKTVAGVDEEKEELSEIVDFLKNPKKYIDVGARIPKGVILVGPPGTGKTLLAKAVAGEAGVPFFYISGSDFVEMFVGVGASRVRDMFEEAKKNAPCIIFIDEIDAVARRRGAGMGGGHDEREQTLNQLLVEMDGFSVNEGIIVLSATNRVDILDPAIMRPGRFDRKIYVNRPDIKGREDILKVHAKNKPLSDDVDLHEVAQTTAGFTGADLENLLNEAAINAAKEEIKFIRNEDIKKAFIKVGVGVEKKSRTITEKERRMTAYHEAGHAILMHLLPEAGPVYMVSIIPTGSAGGYTMPLPERDDMYISKTRLLNALVVDLGGRAAEEIVFDDVTTGASQDIKQATHTAHDMVLRYGFSDKLGLINYANDDEEVFIGRDYGHTKAYGADTANLIDSEVRELVNNAYTEAKRILNENRAVMDKLVELLLEKERITRAEFEALFRAE